MNRVALVIFTHCPSNPFPFLGYAGLAASSLSPSQTPRLLSTPLHCLSTMSSHGRKTILFITPSETGQCNSIFALALELITHPHTDVHVASFSVLRRRAEELSSSARAAEKAHPNSTFTFHEIRGMSFEEAFASKGLSGASFPHPPLARSHDEGITRLLTMLTSWDGKGTSLLFYLAVRNPGRSSLFFSKNTSGWLTVVRTSST